MVSSDGTFGSLSTNVSRFLINYAVRFLFGGLLLYCCWAPLQSVTISFSWHVILCTFGYIPLMAESIMLFIGDELWSRQISRKAKYSIHAVLISLSTMSIIVGNYLVLKYVAAEDHFRSAHGLTGLLSTLLLFISIALGAAVNNPEKIKSLLRICPVWFKLTHNIAGILGFLIGIISLCFGYYTEYFKFYTSAESRLTAVIITVVVSLWALNGAFASAYNQMKTLLT